MGSTFEFFHFSLRSAFFGLGRLYRAMSRSIRSEDEMDALYVSRKAFSIVVSEEKERRSKKMSARYMSVF